jgi:hypothetical protein
MYRIHKYIIYLGLCLFKDAINSSDYRYTDSDDTMISE